MQAAVEQWPTTRAEDSESTDGHRGTQDTLTSATRYWGEAWPTPRTFDAKDLATEPTQSLDRNRSSLVHDGLARGVEMWPTPRTLTGGGESLERKQELGRTESGGGDLQAQTEMWQTPRTPNGGRKLDEATTLRKGMDADGVKRTVDLSNQAEYWPTPNTKDAQSAARHTTETGVMHPGTTLTDAIRQWPTPEAASGGRQSGSFAQKSWQKADGTPRHLSLEQSIQNWPTPAARDKRDPNAQPDRERNRGTKGEQLQNFVAHQWRTPNTRDHHLQGPREEHPQRQLSVADQAVNWETPEQWPTPRVGTHGGWETQEMKDARASKTGIDLEGKTMNWETPTSRDWKSETGSEGNSYEKTPNLSRQVYRMQENFWKRPHGLQYKPEEGDPGGGGEFADQATKWNSRSSLPAPPIPDGLPFYERVRILRRLCRLLQERLPKVYARPGRFENGKWLRAAIFRKKLNADFTDWLQGLVPGFTSVEFDSRLMEIWWSASRRHVHFLSSPGDSEC